MNVLKVENNYSCLHTENQEIIDTLWKLLRFRERGYFHSRLYKQHKWDGFRDFFSIKTGKFLTGLLPEVRLVLKQLNVEYEVVDNRDKFEFYHHEVDKHFMNYGDNPIELYDYQVELVNQILKHKRGIIFAPTGCHRRGQKILMYNGQIKAVEDIKVGEQLMGVDSTPRTVLQLCRGKDEMYEVIPKRGDPFVVNGDHLITVTKTPSHTNRYEGEKGGGLFEIKAKEWNNLSNWSKHIFKLKKSECIKFTSKGQGHLPIDPYFLGVLIGDGSLKNSVRVTNIDEEIVTEVYQQADCWNMTVRVDDRVDRTTTYCLTKKERNKYPNPIQTQIRLLGLDVNSEHKFIPNIYKTSSVKNRLKIIAGLLDTDGSLYRNSYDFVSKSRQLAEDLVFVVRSVGLHANIKPCKKGCQTGAVGDYFRVYIGGKVSKIPCKIKRKRTSDNGINNSLRVGFKVKKLDLIEDYYGFVLDGDQRYILDDFTITHNSGKTNVMCAFVKCLPPKTPTLILGNKKSLVKQNYKELAQWGIPNIGVLYDEEQSPNFITCSTIQSAHKLESILPKIKVLIVDEIHEMMSKTPMTVYRKLNNAVVRVGMSATPYKFDGKDEVQKYRVKGWIGPPFKIHTAPDSKLTTKFLQSRNTLSPSKCYFYPITEPQLPYEIYQDAITKGIAESIYFNKTVARLVEKLQGRTLILVERLAAGDDLAARIPGAFWIKGEDDTTTRDQVVAYLKNYKDKVVAIATQGILNTGINVMVHNLINCAGGKADHQIAQRIGRGLRTADDKETLNYYDWIFKINPYLNNHSEKRIKILKKLGHEIIIKESIDF